MSLAVQTYSSVRDASNAVKPDGIRYLGGGTLVVRAVNEGDLSITGYVRSTAPTLQTIDITDGRATIGASVTMAAILANAELAGLHPVAKAVGGPAVRNMATVGGNLFAPAPYGDFTVGLLAQDATVHSTDGDAPIEDFLAGRHDRGKRGIVKAVSLGVPSDGALRFLKISRVKPRGVSVVTIAAALALDDAGKVKSARVALGCMADRPIRAHAAEQALIGHKLVKEEIREAVAVVGEGTNPITDPVASAWYRSEVLPVHFSRLLLG
ncbi:FAD binding domain-containing protein [Hoeflea sp. CAU 1731]